MKKLLATAVIALLAASPVWAGAESGVWQTAEGQDGGYLFVKIGPCGTKICGKIIGAVNKEGKKDPKYAHLGKEIIWNMVDDGAGYYSGGTVWAPDSNKKYSAKMILKGNVLVVKGCIFGFICRGQDWKRVK